MVFLPLTRPISFTTFYNIHSIRYTYDLTSKYGRLKRTGESFDVLADQTFDIGIEVHASCYVECAGDVTSQYTLVYSEGGLVFGGQE